MISRELETEILRLYHAEGWRIGTLARQLHVHRDTVRRVLSQAGIALARQYVRAWMLDPYAAFIQGTFARYPTLRASRLYQMLRARGYTGGPDHFRHSVARYRPRQHAEAYLRLRTLAGEQGQVDWAHFGKIDIGRARRPLMAFVMVLSYSRHLFLRFYLNAAMGSFLHGHAAAFLERWCTAVKEQQPVAQIPLTAKPLRKRACISGSALISRSFPALSVKPLWPARSAGPRILVAVGTALTGGPPRIGPYGQHYCIRLLPRIRSASRSSGQGWRMRASRPPSSSSIRSPASAVRMSSPEL